MGPDSGPPGYLEVNEQISGVHLIYQVLKQRLQLCLCAWHLNPDKAGAVEEAVNMLVNCKNLVIAAGTCVVYAVSKPTYPVIHGNAHILQFAVLSIIITKRFHICNLLFNKVLIGTCC